MVLGVFAVVEIITANLIEPWLYGRSTGITPLAVLLSAVFWAWIWGPIGLLLSMPLTVSLVSIGR
jgi:predicted PurR-regulated permease PerM